MTGPTKIILGMTTLVFALLALMSPPAFADDAGSLPSGDFDAVFKSTSGAPFALRCTGGTCAFLGGGPRPVSHELKEFAQAPVIDLTHTTKAGGDCGHFYDGPVETMHIDGHGLNYRYDAKAYKADGRCGDLIWSYRQREQHDTFAATVVKLTGPGGKALTSHTNTGNHGSAGATQTNAAKRAAGGQAATASRLSSGGAAAPSVLGALPTVSDTSLGAGHGLALAALVVILVLLIAFPTHLLNSAVESGQDHISAWLRARRGDAAGDKAAPVASRRTWSVATAVVFAASLIGCFVDPGFGFNTGSLRVLLSLFVALAMESLVVWFTVLWLVRRTSPETSAGFRAAPATLLVVLVAVVITRMTGFEPGIIFGLVAGVTFAAARTTAEEGRVALTGVGLGYALALLGWVGYSVAGPSTDGGSFAHNLLSDTLSGLAIAGIASLPLALIPLSNLPGHSLYAWSKPAWAASYALALVGFFLVLMPMPFSWDSVDTPLRTWVLLYLAYAAVAVVSWAALTRPWLRKTVEPA